MVFSSIAFLFLFLPLALGGYLLLRGPFRLLYLLLSSLFFYFFGEQNLIWVMLLSIAIDYTAGLMIAGGFRVSPERLEPGGSRNRRQRIWLGISIAINLGLLVYFKYFNFFVDNTIDVLQAFGMHHHALNGLTRVVLPLGISFYTFQSMSYTIDVYRGAVTANRNLLAFATYVTMFPQLVAGPIVRYRDMEQQITRPAPSMERFGAGIQRFVAGLAKKVLIANAMAPVADHIFSLPPSSLSTGTAWIGLLAFAVQVYFDFSGYSCMAIGLGKMLGFDFQENFNYPHVSRSITEYWTRWHISLTSWFRDYLYIPLGGSRISPMRTNLNIMIVFFVSGLWHGTQWSNILFGVFNGLFLVLERGWLGRLLQRFPNALRHLYFHLVILVSYVFFRTSTPAESLSYLSTLFGLQSAGAYTAIAFLTTPFVLTFIMATCFALPVVPRVLAWGKRLTDRPRLVFQALYLLTLIAAFVLCTADLLSGTYNPFIYFRF
jgi:alginate O-acetyltransferase complex protein AlgI